MSNLINQYIKIWKKTKFLNIIESINIDLKKANNIKNTQITSDSDMAKVLMPSNYNIYMSLCISIKYDSYNLKTDRQMEGHKNPVCIQADQDLIYNYTALPYEPIRNMWMAPAFNAFPYTIFSSQLPTGYAYKRKESGTHLAWHVFAFRLQAAWARARALLTAGLPTFPIFNELMRVFWLQQLLCVTGNGATFWSWSRRPGSRLHAVQALSAGNRIIMRIARIMANTEVRPAMANNAHS